MTRTARAAYPRAVIKDRSESRSGLDSSLRKAGAGHHNWGSLADEQQLEYAALNDRTFDEEELSEALAAAVAEDTNSTRSTRCKFHFSLDMSYLFNATAAVSPSAKPEISSSTSEMSEEELEKARQFRKNTFKKTGGMSYLFTFNITRHLKPPLEIDLTAIARTSVVVGSPPQGDRRPGQDAKRVSTASSVSNRLFRPHASCSYTHLSLSSLNRFPLPSNLLSCPFPPSHKR